MYENGKRVKGYAKKKLHKKKLKKSFAKGQRYYSASADYNEILNMLDTLPEYSQKWLKKYWKLLYLSGPRQYAKFVTSRKLRAEARKIKYLVEIGQIDKIPYLKNKDYEKYFDYDWTIW